MSLLRPDGPPIAGRESLAALLPGAPTAVRTLRQTDNVTALLRVHQSKRGMPQAVVLNTTILDAVGGEVYTASREVASASFADANGVEHRFQLPLEGLEPGDYLLRFIATAGSKSVQRDIRFTVAREQEHLTVSPTFERQRNI